MVTASQETGVAFFGPLPSGPWVGALRLVPFARRLLQVAGLAHALQLLMVVRLGLDVAAVRGRAHAAEDAGRMLGEGFGSELCPGRWQPASPVAALPPSGHGRLLFVGAAFGVAADGPSAEPCPPVGWRGGDDLVQPEGYLFGACEGVVVGAVDFDGDLADTVAQLHRHVRHRRPGIR